MLTRNDKDMSTGFGFAEEKAARKAEDALELLRAYGLKIVWHASSGNLYAVREETFENLNSSETNDDDKYLPCGSISDGGDW